MITTTTPAINRVVLLLLVEVNVVVTMDVAVTEVAVVTVEVAVTEVAVVTVEVATEVVGEVEVVVVTVTGLRTFRPVYW